MMTRFLSIGLALVINVVILTTGILWSKRQVKRVVSERDAAFRALFVLDPLPPPGAEVQVLVEDDDGKVSEIEAVHWPHLGWTDAITLLPIDGDVLGWRWHPFRPRPQRPEDDPENWSREKLAAELAKLASDAPRP